MSTPEHKPTTTGHIGPEQSAELKTRRARDAAVYDQVTNPTRTTTVISWLGWHLGELTGVTVPLALGASVWDGFYAVSAVTALVWAGNEVRSHRKHTTTAPRTRSAATAAPKPESTGDGEAE